MNERGKSDSPVVPAKPPNKAASAAAEVVEERGLAKGNTTRPTRPGRSAGPGVPHGLDRSSGSRTGYPAAISNRSRHAMIHAFKVQRRQSIQCPRVLVTGPVQFTLVQLGAIGLWSALMSAASPASLNRLKPDCRSSQVKGTFGVAKRWRTRHPGPASLHGPSGQRCGQAGACPPQRAAPPKTPADLGR